jgi:hypothetical protein
MFSFRASQHLSPNQKGVCTNEVVLELEYVVELELVMIVLARCE